jgi:hypothetical protein
METNTNQTIQKIKSYSVMILICLTVLFIYSIYAKYESEKEWEEIKKVHGW